MLAVIPPRPNRLDPESSGFDGKDKDYHSTYARWCIGNYNIYNHQAFVSRYLTNVAFYKGDQWIFEEDLEAFLMDESGEVRNRIKWVQNIVKPFVEYFRGSAIKMNLNAEVVSISRESKSRRDTALDQLLYWTKVAARTQQSNPQLAQQIRQQQGVGNSTDETTATFNNLYIDEYTRNMNYLLKYIAFIKNDVKGYQSKVAEDLALAGIGILREDARNEEQIWTRTAPERFIFDFTAELPDLRDAEFMGEFELRSGTDLYEQYQTLDSEERERIEQASLANIIGLHNIMSFYTNYAQKLPTYRMHWRDIELNKHGAFYDEFGYPMLMEISKEHPENELIPVKDLGQFADDYEWIRTILNKDIVGGDKKLTKNKAIVPTDSCRYCDFIPAEYINSAGGGPATDIVLAYGIRPYSQRYSYRHEWIEYPYMVSTYSYILGEVTGPIDTLISPQRMINRVNSVAESHINNSRGSGTIIDKDTVDPQGGEEEIQRNMNQSRPIFLNAQRQLNNALGSYDATIKQGTLSLFDIASKMKEVANNNFGGGAGLTGGVDSYRGTASIADQNAQQGGIMQEPFFHGIEKIYMKAYNSMVNRGKRIYASNQRQLALEVGDEGVVVFKLSAEYDTEDFRAKIMRSPNEYDERDSARQMLMLFKQQQMIDQQTFAKYFGNSQLTMTDVAYALREYTGLLVEQQKAAAAQAPAIQQANTSQALAANELQHNQNMEQQSQGFAQQSALQTSKNNAGIIQAAIQAKDKNPVSTPVKQ